MVRGLLRLRVRAALTRVALDEATHAEFGWSVARFCVAHLSSDDARRAIDEALGRNVGRAPRRPQGLDATLLTAHGKPPRKVLGLVERRERAATIRVARALLGGAPPIAVTHLLPA